MTQSFHWLVTFAFHFVVKTIQSEHKFIFTFSGLISGSRFSTFYLIFIYFSVWLMAGIVNIHKGKNNNLLILKDIVTVSFLVVLCFAVACCVFGRQSFGFDLNLFNFHYYYFLWLLFLDFISLPVWMTNEDGWLMFS